MPMQKEQVLPAIDESAPVNGNRVLILLFSHLDQGANVSPPSDDRVIQFHFASIPAGTLSVHTDMDHPIRPGLHSSTMQPIHQRLGAAMVHNPP